MDTRLSCAGKDYVFCGEEDDDYFKIWRELGFYGGKRDIVPYELVVKDDTVCIDVGANIGLTAVLTKALAPNGKWYGFEPSPTNFAHLVRTIDLNNFTDCVPIMAAVGATPGSLRISGTGAHTHIDTEGIEVPVITLNDWAKSENLKRLDFLKIDVEGFELQVLQGADQVIKEFKPVALIEFNSLATIVIGRLLPQDLLDAILDIFPHVSVIDLYTGLPKKLGREPADRRAFIGDNLMNGFVHDLLCYFDESQIKMPKDS